MVGLFSLGAAGTTNTEGGNRAGRGRFGQIHKNSTFGQLTNEVHSDTKLREAAEAVGQLALFGSVGFIIVGLFTGYLAGISMDQLVLYRGRGLSDSAQRVLSGRCSSTHL